MPFEASLSGPVYGHPFTTARRHFVERGDINDSVEALISMLDPSSFVLGNAENAAIALLEVGDVMRSPAGGMTDGVLDHISAVLDEWNPVTYVERLWSSELDDMVHRELVSAILVCLMDFRTRSEHLAFVITRFGPVGMFNGLFQVGRDETRSVLHIDPDWEPAVMAAKLVKKLRKVGLNDWGHLMALCHLFGRYCEALSGRRVRHGSMVIGLNFYDL